ncbi:hypothetical protein BJ875DRAFT_105229 [Amylocarpus encephaloides]|uniref:Uncharacterized protein n=1 Tax=Amylocarpus encephaloides TaxID=45428 RepID=A0A9P7YDE7_9HELO|nr:hypothetical protein BJ875DRAFT_105229 [Amylocarpus encephaloides]
MPTNGKPGANSRFELSFTPINFSLTDGTNIPPPPLSPVEEQPPPTPPKPQLRANTSAAANGSMPPPSSTGVNGFANSHSRMNSTDIPPLSPASSKRPSSIRRFVSRMSLNQSYTDGNDGSQEDLHGIARPPSQASVMTTDRPGLKPRRTSSWFKRFSSAPAAPMQNHQVPQSPGIERKPVQKAVPPPTLPEKYTLKSKIPEADEGMGEDMFKNIR